MAKKDYFIDSIEEFNKEKSQRESTFNGLSASEWAKGSRSVWNDLPFPRSENKVFGQDVIDEDVFARIITMYSKEEDTVLDPYMGYGNSLVAAIHNNRHAIGFEQDSVKYVEANNHLVSSMNLLVNSDYKTFNNDFDEFADYIEPESVQLALTSVIFNIEEKENTNFTYEDYLYNFDKMFNRLYDKVKSGGYVAVIVRDFRDIQNGKPYVECHSDVAKLGQKNGFLYQDVIIYDHNDSRGRLLLGYPSVFYVNLNHSYIVILRKQ
jgi:DNA modification methylase